LDKYFAKKKYVEILLLFVYFALSFTCLFGRDLLSIFMNGGYAGLFIEIAEIN